MVRWYVELLKEYWKCFVVFLSRFLVLYMVCSLELSSLWLVGADLFSDYCNHYLVGSMSLHLGTEIFDIFSMPMQDHNHLYIRQGTGLQGQAMFRNKLSFRYGLIYPALEFLNLPGINSCDLLSSLGHIQQTLLLTEKWLCHSLIGQINHRKSKYYPLQVNFIFTRSWNYP